jgi:bleomycin hydrolase
MKYIYELRLRKSTISGYKNQGIMITKRTPHLGIWLTMLLVCGIPHFAGIAQAQLLRYIPKYEDPVLASIKARNQRQQNQRQVETVRILARQAKAKQPAMQLRCGLTSIQAPSSPQVFQSVFHFPPLRQYLTGSCWCFSTTSFFESEVYRLSGKKIKLSEMFTVYHEYQGKARRYIQERGDSFFDEASEGNAVISVWRKYGIVPALVYKGVLAPAGRHDHSEMVAEMKAHLDYVSERNFWNEEQSLTILKLIMDKHMGSPPNNFVFNNERMHARHFLEQELKLKLDDYVSVMSTLKTPFYSYGEYTVEANWWHSQDYYNVPIEQFLAIIKYAIQHGYSIRLNGDVSEPGYIGEADVAFVPEFDIPVEKISQEARELRFANGTTADDHDVHLVGYTRIGPYDWFLIKDSSSSAQQGRHKGYYFYREDYIKLKMLTFIAHKDVVRAVVDSFK